MVDSDTLKYSILKEEESQEVVDFLAEHFFPREPLSTGLHMTYKDNMEWIPNSVLEWAQSGVSVIARVPDTGKIGGILLATILTREQTTTYQHALNSPKTKVKTLHTVLSVLETAVDFFKCYQNVDRILELAMITVPEKMGGRGVGRRLVQESERLGCQKGCQLATSQATAVPSQRLLQRLGYESLYTMDYTTFEIAGERVFDVDKMLGTTSAKVMVHEFKPEDKQVHSKE
ncbi:arylalkylamine N-acetyltransferase-like 2 [Scylla paramamosain]|uniref:arylalkylamine N-acetyltransferase-like 2 n=1 Tax=Scylla paramamosain TaxID=85552 RepID=UPI0030836B40